MPLKIFFVFLAVGLVIAGGPSIYYVWAWLDAAEGRAWPTVEARIISLDVEQRTSRSSGSSGSRSSVTYYPKISYAYRIGNRELRGDRVWLTGAQFYNDGDDAEAFVQEYRVGQTVPLSVDPANPGHTALLIENPPWQILPFIAVGLLWIWLSVYFRRFGPGGTGIRLATCRNCKVRLPRSDFSRSTMSMRNFRAAKRGTGSHVCPRCGSTNPLSSLRMKPEMVIFVVAFFGIWAVGLYLLFFA